MLIGTWDAQNSVNDNWHFDLHAKKLSCLWKHLYTSLIKVIDLREWFIHDAHLNIFTTNSVVPTRKAIWYIVETPIHYVTLHGSARRSFAPLRPCYENRAEFTILMCEQEPHPVWLSCRRKSYMGYHERSLNCVRNCFQNIQRLFCKHHTIND